VVNAQTADLPLATPLQVGSNLFNVDIDRPSNGRDEKVSLVVKIGYRIRPDLSLLDTEHPLLRVAVDGTAGATVEVDGKPLTLGTDGKGAYDVDITSECQGASDETKTVERAVSYSVVSVNGTPEKGAVNMRVTVSPLHIDSPFSRTVIETDHVVVAGKTGRGARLSVNGQPVIVGNDGGFSTMAATPTLGSNPIAFRTSVPGQAPRMFVFTVKRVERLTDEAREFTASAPLVFSDLTADIGKHLGEPIVITGEVAESRAQGARTVALIDVQKGCPRSPCLARVVLPSEEPPKRGDHLQVFGWVTRAVNA
jgi:hypothetical protein